MKRISTVLMMVVALALTMVSCKKTESPAPNNNNNNSSNDYYFTAKIDGAAWSADMSHQSTFIKAPHPGMLTISGSLSQVTEGFFLGNLYKYTGAGTYVVGVGGDNSYIRYTSGSVGAGTYSAWKAEEPGSTTTGKVVITKDDGTVVEGTFEFEGYSEEKKTKKMITEGKFRVKKG